MGLEGGLEYLAYFCWRYNIESVDGVLRGCLEFDVLDLSMCGLCYDRYQVLLVYLNGFVVER